MTDAVSVMVVDEDLEQARIFGALICRRRPAWELAGIGTSHHELLAMVASVKPDVAFVGMHIRGDAALRHARCVVYMSPDPAQALDALDRNGLDYLLKPATPARVDQCLAKVETWLGRLQSRHACRDILALTAGRETFFVSAERVICLRSEARHTLVIWDDGECLCRQTLGVLERTLDSGMFVRAHRGAIVNMRRVRRALRDDMGRLWLCMERDIRIHVSHANERFFLGNWR